MPTLAQVFADIYDYCNKNNAEVAMRLKNGQLHASKHLITAVQMIRDLSKNQDENGMPALFEQWKLFMTTDAWDGYRKGSYPKATISEIDKIMRLAYTDYYERHSKTRDQRTRSTPSSQDQGRCHAYAGNGERCRNPIKNGNRRYCARHT